jgi:putative membrane protein
MYDGWGSGWGWGAWLAMALMMVAFWGIVAVLVVYVIRNVSHRPESSMGASDGGQNQALRILDERFARGEIDLDEYSQRRNALRSR